MRSSQLVVDTAAVGLLATNALVGSDSDADHHGVDDEDEDVAALSAVGDESTHGAVGMIRKNPRDERRKRSAALDHTAPYKVVVDQNGVEFDVRACKYCDAVFSFKGGTTSAALRHLKSTHPQEFFEGATVVDADVATIAVDGGDAVDQAENGNQGKELHSDLNTDAAVEELPPSTAPVTSSSASKKRRRYDGDYVAGKPTRQTANQEAITHFLGHYKSLMDPRMRLTFVKHLSYNDREAEMYNVLDDETRLEFVTEFAKQQIPPSGL